MPLTLECAGMVAMSSAYFVVFLSRTDVPVGDAPMMLDCNLAGGITTLDVGKDNWNASVVQPSPANGVWSAATVYTTGQTVSTDNIVTSSSAILCPLTYRALSGNTGRDPDDYEGYWTCTTQPPHTQVTNKNYLPVSFGYALSPLPTKVTLAAAAWEAALWGSVFWSVTPPGDIVQLMDVYVRMNYLVGGNIVPLMARPQTAAATGSGSTSGLIYNPGINAQLQTWHSSTPSRTLTLSNFLPLPVDGFEALGTTGEAYISAIVASGGTPPYVYGLISGSLPEGVRLDAATGIISGTPTNSGIFTFTAQVTDATGATAQVTCAAPIECGGGGISNAFY